MTQKHSGEFGMYVPVWLASQGRGVFAGRAFAVGQACSSAMTEAAHPRRFHSSAYLIMRVDVPRSDRACSSSGCAPCNVGSHAAEHLEPSCQALQSVQLLRYHEGLGVQVAVWILCGHRCDVGTHGVAKLDGLRLSNYVFTAPTAHPGRGPGGQNEQKCTCTQMN
eukprot:1734255-Amphidinium_carterae.1